MVGEQKHKVFKQHATHTNSRENDVQLLRATNTSQTLRFLLDGTFDHSYPRVSKQLRGITQSCPFLKQRFLGCKEVATAMDQCSGIDVAGSILRSSRTGCPIVGIRVQPTEKEYDMS